MTSLWPSFTFYGHSTSHWGVEWSKCLRAEEPSLWTMLLLWQHVRFLCPFGQRHDTRAKICWLISNQIGATGNERQSSENDTWSLKYLQHTSYKSSNVCSLLLHVHPDDSFYCHCWFRHTLVQQVSNNKCIQTPFVLRQSHKPLTKTYQ